MCFKNCFFLDQLVTSIRTQLVVPLRFSGRPKYCDLVDR